MGGIKLGLEFYMARGAAGIASLAELGLPVFLDLKFHDIPNTVTGAIRAMGEHKGSGLALVCELLAGALTNSGCCGPDNRPTANGMLSFYIDPKALGLAQSMAAEARQYLDWVKTSRPGSPGGEVLLPGEPERRLKAKRVADGIPLSQAAWNSICDTARAAGIEAARYGL